MAYKLLSVSDVASLFSNDRVRNTKYLESAVNNPRTPFENIEVLLQYRDQNPEQFLTNEEIDSNRGIFKKIRNQVSYNTKKGYQNVGGYSYNVYSGERSESRDPNFREYRPSGFLVTKGKKNDPDQPLSASKVNQLMFGLKSNYARTRYFQKVRDNPKSNAETIDNLIAWKDKHPDLMVSEEAAAKIASDRKKGIPYRGNGNGKYRFSSWGKKSYSPKHQTTSGSDYVRKRGWFKKSTRDYDKESFDSAWTPKEEFDTYSPKQKSLLSTFIKSKDRNRNCKLATKAYSTSDPETVKALNSIVAKHPGLFFKGKK